jgi:hypothetical protein
VKADASVLETASTQYAVRDIRVMMKEPLVRNLAVIGAVYNGVERVRSLSRPLGLYARRHGISNLHVFSCKAVQQYRAAGLLPLKRRL